MQYLGPPEGGSLSLIPWSGSFAPGDPPDWCGILMGSSPLYFMWFNAALSLSHPLSLHDVKTWNWLQSVGWRMPPYGLSSLRRFPLRWDRGVLASSQLVLRCRTKLKSHPLHLYLPSGFLGGEQSVPFGTKAGKGRKISVFWYFHSLLPLHALYFSRFLVWIAGTAPLSVFLPWITSSHYPCIFTRYVAQVFFSF